MKRWLVHGRKLRGRIEEPKMLALVAIGQFHIFRRDVNDLPIIALAIGADSENRDFAPKPSHVVNRERAPV